MKEKQTFRIGFQHILETCEVGTRPSLEVFYDVNGVDKVRCFKVTTIGFNGKFVLPTSLSDLPQISGMLVYMSNILTMLDREIPTIKELVYHGKLLSDIHIAPETYGWIQSPAAT